MKEFLIEILDKLISLSRYIRYIFFLTLTPICEPMTKKMFATCDIQVNGNRPWDIKIKDRRFYARLMSHGDLGLGEMYLEGWWECEDVRKLFANLLENPTIRNSFSLSPAYIESLLRWTFFNLQSRELALTPSKQPVYSLPKEYYEALTEETITYSAGYYGFGAQSMAEAQIHKMHLLASKLELKPGMKILDVGCGFGGLCRFLSEEYGVECVGVVNSEVMGLSAEKYCNTDIKGPRVEIQISDWRDIQGAYDRIYVIEMLDHVGRHNLRQFYSKMDSLLKPGGSILAQVYSRGVNDPTVSDFASTYLYGPVYFTTLGETVKVSGQYLDLVDVQDISMDSKLTVDDYIRNIRRNYNKLVGIVGEKVVKSVLYVYSLINVGDARIFHLVWVKKGERGRRNFPRDRNQVLKNSK